MSLRLDPRRLSTLKRLAADAGMRPGDLVRTWVEERIDAERGGATAPSGGVLARLDELAARVASLEAMAVSGPKAQPAPTPSSAPEAEPSPEVGGEPAEAAAGRRRARRNAVSVAPSGGRVALHEEMIEILRERGPMTAAELADAIVERGRYAPPRSGKPLDAAMVSQRVSNPTYRGRFTRNEGKIGLADEAE